MKMYPSILILAMAMYSCAKNELAIVQPAKTSLLVKAVTVDALRLEVKANGELLTHELITPEGSQSIPATYFDPLHHIQVTDLYSQTPMADTMVTYTGGSETMISFFQPEPGARLVYVGPPVNEPAPAPGTIKMAIAYNLLSLPNEVKVVVENKFNTPDYVATDSFLLAKGAVSKYFVGNNSTKPRVRLYTTGVERILQAEIAPNLFSQVNKNFSAHCVRSIGNNKIATLTQLY